MAETNLDGAAYAVFEVVLSEASESTIDIDWHTEDGTGKAGTDYQQGAGTLTFAPGETQKQVQVLVYGRSPTASTDARTFKLRLEPAADVILNTSNTTECRIEVKTAEDGAIFTSVVVARGPKGTKGDGGLNTYELAKLQGFVGTLAEYLASLRGLPGPNIELQATETLIQWRVAGDTDWNDLMPRSDLAGREVELRKGQTAIQWHYAGDTSWTDLIQISELKGAKGDTGAALVNRGRWAAGTFTPGDYVVATGSAGTDSVWILKDTAEYASTTAPKNDATHWVEVIVPAGADGREVQLQKGSTALQWRYVGQTAWTDLIALADLKGADGEARGWLSGSGAPASTTGADGNMYLDVATATNGNVYQKSGGAWTLVGNILGPAGSGSTTFATTEEAKDATITTKASSPARVREFVEQFGFTGTFTTMADDMNTVVEGSFFNYGSSTAHAPAGTIGWGRGIALPSGEGYVTQLAIENDTGKMFVRYQTGGTWGSWAAVGGSSSGGSSGGDSGAMKAVLKADKGVTEIDLSDTLTWTVAADTAYAVRIVMPYRTNATTQGIAVGFGGTAGFQTIALQARAMASDGTMLSKTVKAKDTKMIFPTSAQTTGDNLLVVEGVLLPTAAGTFTFQIAAAVLNEYCAAQKGTAGVVEAIGSTAA